MSKNLVPCPILARLAQIQTANFFFFSKVLVRQSTTDGWKDRLTNQQTDK